MINSFHLEIKAPLSSLGLLQGAGLLLQAWGMGLKRPFSKSQEEPSWDSPPSAPLPMLTPPPQSPVLDGGVGGGGKRVGHKAPHS